MTPTPEFTAFDAAVLAAYLLLMIGIGAWARYRSRHRDAYLVAGRRLGPFMYTSTMSAVIIGGAATVGGVGLGYSLGAAGVWMITAIAVGVAVLSLLFAVVIRRSRVYTLPELVERRYGHLTARMSAWVMVAYTFLITTTSTLAYGSVLSVVFGIGRLQAIGIGAAVVVIYSLLGGMWSITLTDIVQFTVMTLAFFVLLGPASLQGGSVEALNRLGGEFLDPGSVGFASIFGTFVIYTLGLLLGQDIWQRVATARAPGIARWGGFASAIYVTLFGIVTTFIGMAAAVKWPGIDNRDAVFAIAVGELLPQGLAGLALSGAVAAMMSTTSGGLIATATVLREDILPTLSPRYAVPGGGRAPIDATMRVLVAVLGVLAAAPALVLDDVVTALTLTYNVLVCGMLFPVLGGIIWRRPSRVAAISSIFAGIIVLVVTTVIYGDILAYEPLYWSLGASGLVFILVGALGPKSTAGSLMMTEEEVAALEAAGASGADGADEAAAAEAAAAGGASRA